MQKYFFTSDTHLSHRNIIKYCRRPFATIEEMNEAIISRWNSVVGKHDVVYHLGDVSFEKDKTKLTWMLRRLNGSKHIVWGNHDKGMKEAILAADWHDCGELHTLNVPPESNNGVGQKIILCHYPLLTWDQSHHGSWMLHGHCHHTLPPDQNSLRIDVGVDGWDYRPVTMEQLRQEMSRKKFKPVDRHGKDDCLVCCYI
jgi:calcineurin-like phosphoesterase family protein